MTARSDSEEIGFGRSTSGGGFQLDSSPLLAGSPVELSDVHRDDPDTAAELWRDGEVLLVDEYGRTPVDAEGSLAWADPGDCGNGTNAVLLGLYQGRARWGMRASARGSELLWSDLRVLGDWLGEAESGLFATAVGLLAWHDRARYCALCGAGTNRIRSGWARRCGGCWHEEYPRTDPSMICLVHDGGDQVLLARKAGWPEERFSVLAGFVEMGESLEGCVRREVREEVGMEVSDIRYLGSQPWPFPRSLMVGFAAVADPEEPLHPVDGEIAEAHWVSREHVRQALETDGPVRGVRMPPGISIAYRMLRGWALS
ncbi:MULTISPECIES: NAD(+) diphosphatase [Actinopolyspora]|uniref:NAD(+) diphosphatase n=1 Tax=Actinopolyspora saharensis TaxID=995062 RepID=A0A1H1H4G4_9ACTN|nr:NAD(+) diphosphatase [Actinopolyspora saharensis]NHD17989.1 NAD(+) diphosphatase [Actinopolyspora sp. BKK2]NHE77862.1 NAD(+) diphosphatase [Actinopolyspora sp. BKK1]SDR19966.1 NAD+ diphosphatase [Actinopolyspora saharensis]